MKSTRELRKAPDLRFAASRESRADSTRSQVNTNYQHINIWGIPGNTLRRTQIVVHRHQGVQKPNTVSPSTLQKQGLLMELKALTNLTFLETLDIMTTPIKTTILIFILKNLIAFAGFCCGHVNRRGLYFIANGGPKRLAVALPQPVSGRCLKVTNLRIEVLSMNATSMVVLACAGFLYIVRRAM